MSDSNMIQAFQAAKEQAPCIVLIEGVELLFISDKTRAAALPAGPASQPLKNLRQPLLNEVG